MDQAVEVAPNPLIEMHRLSGREWLAATVVLTIVTALTRASAYGNPVYQVDDQFYLHVGQAMLQGQLPYVDVIDRKPLGLFLIYAAISLTGGDGVPDYQIVAGIFAFATSLVIWRFGLLISNNLGGLAAAAAYLVTLPIFGGAGGQAPVFYNLPVALAAYWTYCALSSPCKADWRAYAAMAAAGLAITIKTVAVIEGVFFGIVLLVARQRRSGMNATLAIHAIILIAIALLPTALFFALYAGAGHASEFWFANFVSIFLKTNISNQTSLIGASRLIFFLFPLFFMAIAGTVGRLRDSHRLSFIDGWLLAALLGFLAVPDFYSHYLLPLLVPLSVSAATAMAHPVGAALGLSLIALISWFNGNVRDIDTPEARRGYASLVKDIRRELKSQGTLFVFEGPPLLYRSTGTRPLSRIVFPDHFVSERERAALGIDPNAELARILNCRPETIITDKLEPRDSNLHAKAMVTSALQRHYALAAAIPLSAERYPNIIYVWRRRGSSRTHDDCL